MLFREDPLDPDAIWEAVLDLDDLTPKQRAMLIYIARYTYYNGFPPLTREIANHFGSRLSAGTIMMVRRLVKKGRLEIVRGCGKSVTARSRSIRIVGLRWIPVRETASERAANPFGAHSSGVSESTRTEHSRGDSAKAANVNGTHGAAHEDRGINSGFPAQGGTDRRV